MDESTAVTANKALSDELLRRVGRNLLIFQQIEGLLKFLLANHQGDGTPDNFLARQQALAEKLKTKTMGGLTKQYADRVLSAADEPGPDPEETTEGWISSRFTVTGSSDSHESQRANMQMMVDERNDLVHHFLPRWRPDSTDRMTKALAYLDEQRGRVVPMFEHLKSVSQSMQKARQLTASLAASEGYAIAFELVWLQQSPLVSLLRDVALQNPRADGWAYLADAGRIARLREADAVLNMKARYGHATLKRLLVAAALFDVFDEPLPGSGSRTIYRLRSADVPLRSINRDPQSPCPPAT